MSHIGLSLTGGIQMIKRKLPDTLIIVVLLFVSSTVLAGEGLNNGLVLYYSFDGNLQDQSGNGNDGVGSGGLTYVQGVKGKAVSFDGTNDSIRIWSTSEINQWVNSVEGSISVWVKPNRSTNSSFVYQYFSGTEHADRLYLSMHPNYDPPGFALGSSSVILTAMNKDGETWYHIVSVWTPDGKIKVYVNGVLNAEGICENSGFVFQEFALGDPEYFYLGRGWRGNPGYYCGCIDEFRIYNRALSEAEVRTLFNELTYPFGYASISITPADAVAAGAQWRVDGGRWHGSGETQYGLSVGQHTVSFKTIDGWSKPSNQIVTITQNELTEITATYIQTNIQTCTLEGVVTATDGSGGAAAPIAAAIVNLSGYGSTNTDTDGTYSFPSVPPGTYTVTVNKSGYYSSQRQITLEAGTTITENFLLTEMRATSEPAVFDFLSPDGKYFVDGITDEIHFKTKVAWNGSAGTVKFIINDEAYEGTITDLGDGTALVEVTIPSLATIATAQQLIIEVTNGDGVTIKFNPEVYFSHIFDYIPWSDFPFVWTRSGPALLFSSEHSFDKKLPTGSDDIEMSASLGYEMGLQYYLFSGNLEGTLTGSGSLEFKMPTSNPKIRIIGSGKLALDGELDLSIAQLPQLNGSASWTFSEEGTTGIEAPVVIALDAVAPGVGTTLASIPVINDLDIGVYLTVGGSLTAVYDDLTDGDCWFGANSNSGTITGELKAELSAEVGKVEAGVYSGGKGTFDIGLCPDFEFEAFNGKLYAGAYAKAFGLEMTKETAAEVRWEFTEEGQAIAKVQSIGPVRTTGRAESWQPIARSPLKWGPTNRLARKLSAMDTGGGEGPQAGAEEKVVENVTWLAHPSTFANTTDTRVIYSLHDTEKPWYAATDIGQVYKHDDEDWALSRITDDEAAEFNPEMIALDSGSLLAAWVRVSGDISDAESPDDILPHLEIVTSLYDPGTQSWSTPSQLTDNNVVDRDPVPVSFGENKGVIWIENEGEVEPGTSTSGDRLLYASWDGTTWGSPVTLWSGQKGIISFSFVSDAQDEAHIVMAVDEDGDPATHGDRELYHILTQEGVWQAAQRLTDDSIEDSLPTLVAPDGSPMVVWSCGGTLKYTLLGDWNPNDVYAQEPLVGKAPTLDGVTIPGGAAIAYAAQGPEGVDIVAAFYDSDLDQWSLPRKLTHDDATERAISMAYNGSELAMAYLKTQTIREDVEADLDGDGVNETTIENVPKPGRTDLYVLYYSLGEDLAVRPGSIGVDPANPAPGTTASIHATIENLGDLPAEDIQVAAYDGDPDMGGTLIAQTSIGELMAGGSEVVSIPWGVPSDLDAHRIYVVVDPQLNFDDRDRSNNNDSVWCVLPDMVVQTGSSEVISDGQFSITTRVANQGVIPTGLFRVSWRLGADDGPEITSKEVETIPAGSFRDVSIVWDMNGYDIRTGVATIYTVIDPSNQVIEADESNNTYFLTVAHPDALIDSDGDGLSDYVEDRGCTLTDDGDTDNDGITDGIEDSNHNGVVDAGETDPCNIDSDGDGIQDGTELGYTLDDIGPDTDTGVFQPDLDPSTTTDPLDTDTDGDGIEDGFEDVNKNGAVDTWEPDPNEKTYDIAPDFDNDGDVDGGDLAVFASGFGVDFGEEHLGVLAAYLGYSCFPSDPDLDGILNDGDFSGIAVTIHALGE